MSKYQELTAGQHLRVIRQGRALDGSYDSTVRHVGDDGMRIDLPARGGDMLALSPGDDVTLYVAWHRRLYSLTARVRFAEATPVRSVVLGQPKTAVRVERRLFYRLPVSIRPRVASLLDEAGEVAEGIDAQVLDLSGGGVQLRTRRPVTVGTWLRPAFELGRDPLRVDVGVTETAAFRPAARRSVYRVNARFLDVDKAERERSSAGCFSSRSSTARRAWHRCR